MQSENRKDQNDRASTMQDLFDRLPGEVLSERDGWVTNCPNGKGHKHNDARPSLRISVAENGTVLVHCRAGCRTEDVLGAVGLTLYDLATMQPGDVVSTLPRSRPPDAEDLRALQRYLEETAARLRDPHDPHAAQALEYVCRRFGLDAESALALGLGVDPGGDAHDFAHRGPSFRRAPRLVVPHRGFDGVARGLQGRALDDDPVKWASLTGLGVSWAAYGVLDPWAELETYLVTEGTSDALTGYAAGYPTIAILGAGRSRVVEELVSHLRDKHVVVVGDRDPAGEGFARRTAERLAALGLHVSTLAIPAEVPGDGADLTDWRRHDPEGFGEALSRAIREAPPVARAPSTAAPAAGQHPRTELGNAMRARDRLQGLVRYCPALGFLLWNGASWELDATNRVKTEIQQSALDLMDEAEQMPRDTDEQAERRRLAVRWARASQSGRNLDNVERQLRALRGVAVSHEALDVQPDLLACANGTIELRTGRLRPADPADLLTRALAIAYDPDATAPRWERFLREVFPDSPETIEYLQRLVGYAITGHATEECWALFVGGGRNGKSTFTTALYHVLRPITTVTDIATLMTSAQPDRGSAPSPHIAALRGARLVLTSEAEHGQRLAERRLKLLTGTDPVSARHLHQAPLEFLPSFLLIMSTNVRPEIRGQDDGTWRRIKVVEWRQSFEGREDRGLADKLRAEAEGILAWAVEGARRWFADGLGEPPAVTQAVAEYREESDKLRGFFPGVYAKDDTAFVPRGELYRDYETWAESEGADRRQMWRNTTLFNELRAQGVEQVTRRGQRGFRLRWVEEAWKGVQGAPDDEDSVVPSSFEPGVRSIRKRDSEVHPAPSPGDESPTDGSPDLDAPDLGEVFDGRDAAAS